MKSQSRGCWIRLSAGAVFALAATVGIAPATARAGCSHYVVSRTDTAAGLPHLDLLDPAHGASASDVPLVPPSGPKPCSGPMCSGGNPVAPPVPAVPITVRAEQWGCLTALPPLDGPGTAAFLDSDPAARPVRRGPTIDHPPRPSSSRPS